jgi:PAS domain S-box-containing protein
MTKKIEDASIDRPVWIGFGIAFFVLIMVAGISIVNVAQSISSVELLDHTHQVMGQLDDLRIKASRAENRQWAYMLTKDRQALDERDNFIKQIRSSLPPLLELTKDNKAQQARLTQLQVALEERFVILIESQEKFDLEGFKSIQALFDAGQESSNLIRNIIIQAEQEEQGLLVVRKEREFARVKTLAIVTVLLLSFLLFLSAWIRNAIRKRLAVKQEWFDQQAPLLEKGALQDAIFNSANFSSIATDAKGVIQIFNVGAERMLGYTAAEVMNKITPAEISDPQELIARAAELSLELDTTISPGFEALVFKASRGIEDIYELTYIRKDGSRFPAVVSVTALRDAHGEIIGYLLIGTDNTARKQSSQYARSLIEASLDPLVTISADGKITDVNEGSIKVTGVTRQKLIGTDFSNYFTEPESARAGYQEAFSKGSVTDYPLTIRHVDGGLTDVLYNASVYKDVQGNVLGVFAAARDITERKQVEAALLKAGALQRAIFNSANFSSIATDSKGVIQIFNVGAERMLGYAATDVMNTITPADFSDPEELIARANALSLEFGTLIAPGFEALAFKAARGIEDIYELTKIRKDGSRFSAIVSVTALRDAEDVIIGYLLISTDNTERKHAEEALVKAGALQNAIFNSANFSSIATDAKGVIQIFNVGAERMLGYTAAEVMNKITPADISDPQEVIARAEALSLELDTPITPGFEALVFKASRGIEDIYELTYIRKDGSRFPAVVSVTALRDVQNVIIGYLLIGTDNTARKQAEEALLRAGALQSAIFNSANFSSIATDAKGVIQIFNVGAERMLGYTAAEVMNKITPADISDPQEVIARAAALSVELDTPITPGFEALVFKASRGIEDIYELSYIRKDGSRFPAVVSVTALRDAYENIIGYLLIGTDNTARKQVEAERELIDQRLRDLQFYTRSLIESNIDAIMTTNTVGIISDVNHEMEALTGCSREELIGTPFKNYFTDPTRAEAGIKRVLREAKLTNYELTVKAKDGKETIVSYNATTFHDSCNNLMGVFASARDINHRKEFERLMEKNNVELIAATELADKANMAKSEFLSSMSHELRTPLNAVLGFAQLMASDVPPPTASQQMSIDQILQAGWYLLRLINEILDLAMIESGKVMLSQEPMSLAEVLQDCEAMIAPQAQKRGIRMTFPNFDTLFYVHADRTRVKQVMINLLSNAIKYNRDGGKVTVDCIQSGEHSVRVSVTDTGNGLAPKQLEQLFQPFNRLGQESSSKEGTGIGLVVTKQLIELMGGSIGVESRVGIGSIFWVELAASSVPVLKLESDRSDSCIILSNTDTESQVATNKRTILYVEDNPANLALVEQLIARRSDLVLLSAIDGHTGIQMARAYQPDVILMDINLPGISGFAALKMLRKDPLTTEIPVLALSANAMPRDIEKGLEAGFLRYLTKPINVLEFMEALDAALVFSEQMHAEP